MAFTWKQPLQKGIPEEIEVLDEVKNNVNLLGSSLANIVNDSGVLGSQMSTKKDAVEATANPSANGKVNPTYLLFQGGYN